MTLVESLTPLLLIVFPGLLALAASMDLLTMTIPNPIPAALTLGYFAVAATLRVPIDVVLLGLSCGLTILVLMFVLFSLRLIGGGDAKLAAAIGLWVGWPPISDYAIDAALCGGVLTLALLAVRMVELPAILAKEGWISRLHDKEGGVPYGIALATAGLMEYSHSPVWRAAFS